MTEETKDARGAAPGTFGNVPHVPTEEGRAQVERMAGLQISQAEIAMVIGVSTDTIQRHYADEFQRGRALQGMKLREHAYTLAYGKLKNPDAPNEGYVAQFPPDSKMTQFLLERQFGMIPQTQNTISGDPNNPLEVKHIRRTIVDPKDAE